MAGCGDDAAPEGGEGSGGRRLPCRQAREDFLPYFERVERELEELQQQGGTLERARRLAKRVTNRVTN